MWGPSVEFPALKVLLICHVVTNKCMFLKDFEYQLLYYYCLIYLYIPFQEKSFIPNLGSLAKISSSSKLNLLSNYMQW